MVVRTAARAIPGVLARPPLWGVGPLLTDAAARARAHVHIPTVCGRYVRVTHDLAAKDERFAAMLRDPWQEPA